VVDYKKNTGNSGEMMIRDTGGDVEFWLNSHNSTTFNNELPWGYTVNGNTNNDRQTRYSAGAGWVKFGSWNVTTDQTVTFRIFDTGTSGFGGPTTFSVAIDRASAPGISGAVRFTNIGSVSVTASFDDGASNGAAIDQRQLRYSTTNNNSTGTVISSDGSTNVTGLTPGTTYYFWSRVHNSKGWGPWSGVRSFTTLKVPDATNAPVLTNPTQTTVDVSFTVNGDGGNAIVQRQVVWNTTNSNASPAGAATYSGAMTITGLNPGTTYYFWSRARNAIGWGPYSPVTVLATKAGAFVLDGSTWKEAVPYVRDGGVWKLAQPWVRYAGEWKQV
jgi:hypothetical protein